MEQVFELEAQLESLRIRVSELETQVSRYKQAFDIILQEAHYTLYEDTAVRLLMSIDEAADVVKGK